MIFNFPFGKATIYYPRKLINPNVNQCGTQITDLSVMVGRYSLDRQPGGILKHSEVIASSNYW